ncbi:MAG: RNase adapter RapZ [Endomicrobiia bacterium]
MINKKLIIVSGLSGAGKSQVLNILEDNDYFCVDNLPVELIHKFIDLFKNSKRTKFAIGLDIRSAKNIGDLKKAFNTISFKNKNVNVLKLFLDSDDKILIKRFSETRRKHPLGGNLVEAIKKERQIFEGLKKDVDYVINTSTMTLSELKSSVLKVIDEKSAGKINITVMSFGYKYGLPINADIVFDTRFLPNPNYVNKLKHLTGRNKLVRNYVLNLDVTKQFIEFLKNFLDFILPKIFLEGKNYLTLAFGCTGGQHRSVALAESIGKYIVSNKKFKEYKFDVVIQHRDIDFYE